MFPALLLARCLVTGDLWGGRVNGDAAARGLGLVWIT